MDRRVLKPKRRHRQYHNYSRFQEKADDNFATSTPSGSGTKRKFEDDDETPIKRSRRHDEPSGSNRPNKCLANDRLAKYRKALEQKKNQVVKVHKVLDEKPVETKPVDTKPVDNKNVNEKGTSNLSKPMSANERLAKCRKMIEQKKSQVEEVRRVDNRKNPKPVNVSVNTTPSLYQCLPEKALEFRSELESIRFDKTREIDRNDNRFVTEQKGFDEIEDMDWSPINEEALAEDIRKLRNTVRPQPNPLYLNLAAETSVFSRSLIADDPLYVIVDTNIFISHLNLVKDIARLHQRSKLKPTIYIPWMVLQELDFFKDGRAGSPVVQSAAKRAVSFINDMLTKKEKSLKGQTVREALAHEFSNSNADDSILFCCLRLQQNRSKIILLSNDQNLRSKVLVHSIEAASTKTIMDILNGIDKLTEISKLNANSLDENNQKKLDELSPLEKVANIFAVACTEIVKGELEKAYGDTVYKMIAKPPWTLEECLTYIKRFWVPVFSLIITQKQCLKTVDDLLQYIKTHRGMVAESSEADMEEFVKLALSLCVYFKNCLSPYEALMKTCISEIQKTLE